MRDSRPGTKCPGVALRAHPGYGLGIVDLIIAGIIWAGLPGSAAWAIGLLVGIDLVFGGTALIMVALAARRDAAAVA